MKKYFQSRIAIPTDHGSWVFLLSPLLIGLSAGRSLTAASLILVTACLAAFFMRQPVTILVKVLSGRRGHQDFAPAIFWLSIYAIIAVGALAGLVVTGFSYLVWLALPGIVVFLWHLYLVSRRIERRQAGVEIVATGVLSLAAPAAFWVGIETINLTGWYLFGLTWLQSAASIVYAYLRLEQRVLKNVPDRTIQLKMGNRALVYTGFNVILVFILGLLNILPFWLFLPYLVQFTETIWGVFHPAVNLKPSRIGLRQLFVSSLFTILFVFIWTASPA